MKNVIITGSTGMIGSLVLEKCLKSDTVEKITVIARRKSGVQHPKLVEVIHDNFLDYSTVIEHLKNQDVCFYCVGVYTGAVSKDKFREITVDYTNAFAETLRLYNDRTTFCYLSGQGADLEGKSRIMFAKDKGAAERLLIKLNFDQIYLFRPGYIYPSTPRKEPNISYRFMRVIYKPILSKLGSNLSVTSDQLAQAMVNTGLHGGKKVIFENKDIREVLI
ncbi:SDR family oxidoreductase [bacterium]|nr:SDR family oxidoreductase [bacterium]